MTNKNANKFTDIFSTETKIFLKIDLLKLVKFSNLLLENHIQKTISKKYNVSFENIGLDIKSHTMTIVITDVSQYENIKKDIRRAIISYAKRFYNYKHEYESQSPEMRHQTKMSIMVDIGALTTQHFNFEGSINELAYLYSQYKDIL